MYKDNNLPNDSSLLIEMQRIKDENELLKKENEQLKAEKYQLKEAQLVFENIKQTSYSELFICDNISDRIIWRSNNANLDSILDDEYLSCINVLDDNYLKNIHPEDKTLFAVKSLFFKEQKQECLSFIYRYIKKDGSYIWMYLKALLLKNENNIFKSRHICFLTVLDNNLISRKQIMELGKQYLREDYKKTLDNLTQKEHDIIKHLTKGKSRKEIQTLMGINSLAALNHAIKKIYLQNHVKNAAHFGNKFSDFGFM